MHFPLKYNVLSSNVHTMIIIIVDVATTRYRGSSSLFVFRRQEKDIELHLKVYCQFNKCF
jgi:hypothetical protein